MDNNGKDTKHTRNISRIMNFVRNGEEFNFHNTVWCEGGLKLAYFGTKKFREEKLNIRLVYAMAVLDNGQNTCKRGVTGYRRV